MFQSLVHIEQQMKTVIIFIVQCLSEVVSSPRVVVLADIEAITDL